MVEDFGIGKYLEAVLWLRLRNHLRQLLARVEHARLHGRLVAANDFGNLLDGCHVVALDVASFAQAFAESRHTGCNKVGRSVVPSTPGLCGISKIEKIDSAAAEAHSRTAGKRQVLVRKAASKREFHADRCRALAAS